MSQRETSLLWLRDMLEHLTDCQKQLEWSEDHQTVRVLTEGMIRDLDCCKRLCETIHRRTNVKYAV
jgi:hypothetical protein